MPCNNNDNEFSGMRLLSFDFEELIIDDLPKIKSLKYLKESKNNTYNVDNHFVNIVFHDSDTNIDGNVYCKAYNMKTNIIPLSSSDIIMNNINSVSIKFDKGHGNGVTKNILLNSISNNNNNNNLLNNFNYTIYCITTSRKSGKIMNYNDMMSDSFINIEIKG